MPTNKPVFSFFLTLTPELKSFLSKKLRKGKGKIYTEPLSLEKLDPNTEILGVFVDSKVDKKVFAKLPKLKCIVTLSTGFDHIDLKEAKKRGVTVCNVPSYGEVTVAEHAVTLMLALAKHLFVAVKRVKEGDYDYHGLRGFDLEGKTIGVVGTGKIGSHLIQLLQGFNMNILAYDHHKQKELIEKYGVTYVSKTKLFQESDIISLHLPLFPATKHIINKSAIKKMKPGVMIINTARGGLIDASALVWGLEKGIVGGAGIDVLEDENLLEDAMLFCSDNCRPEAAQTALMNNIIIDHPKTIVTPHSAFNTIEAVKRILSTTAENMNAYIAGKPQNKVQ